jgi:hypothetical protein
MLAWFAGLVGIAALGRWLARRTHRAERPEQAGPAPADPAADAQAGDPAAELRRRLAEAREAGPEPPAAPAGAAEETLDERRARVHAQARQAIDAMADDGPAA